MAQAKIQNDLEDQFSSAAKFLESVAMQLGPLELLEFYSYYKQATQGKCNTARPSWFNVTAKQKWDAWNALGDLSQEEAMRKYIILLSQLFPNWNEESTEVSLTSGWVAVSSMAKEEPNLKDSEKDISDWVREGNKEKVKLVAKNHNINDLDSTGLGPIHWAADRGNVDMLRFLVFDLKADVNLKDQEGQTALHYAASCGHVDIVKYLVEHGADIAVEDQDGATPRSVGYEPDILALLS